MHNEHKTHTAYKNKHKLYGRSALIHIHSIPYRAQAVRSASAPSLHSAGALSWTLSPHYLQLSQRPPSMAGNSIGTSPPSVTRSVNKHRRIADAELQIGPAPSACESCLPAAVRQWSFGPQAACMGGGAGPTIWRGARAW